MKFSDRSAGIRDIAEALGISIGTVDRALHDRSGVSAKTKARVLRMVEEMGYKPNVAARSLKLNRNLRIAAILPREISCFFGPMRAGIQAAADAVLGLHVMLDIYEHPNINNGEVELLKTVGAKNYDGILLVAGLPRNLQGLIDEIERGGTTIFCVGCDAPESNRTGSVTLDAYISGGLAAELLSHKLQTSSRVANITGELANSDHAEKLRGFAATLAMLAPHLTLLPVLETHESQEDAYQQARTLLHSRNRPDAIYISTANSMPVFRALEEQKLLGEVQVIATDLYPELVPLLKSGEVLATVYQRPFEQGKMAFEALLQRLVEPDKPANIVRLAPHLVFRSNLRLFAERLSELPALHKVSPASKNRSVRNESRSRRP